MTAGTNPERVNVEYLNNSWVVKNNGDSSVLFRSTDKKAAERFAKEMSEAHSIGIKIYPENKNSKSPVSQADKMKVDVEKREGEWTVKESGKDEILFRSDDKDEAVAFANSLDTGAGLDMHIDKD